MKKAGVGYASVTDLEKQYVLDALEHEHLSQGKYVAEFEKRFASMHGCRYGVMCNSGTSALHIALETLKETERWDASAEVLVPAITFIATPNACIHAGLKVVFVDVDIHTYNMDPADIERHITENTKCIIPVHTFGLPCDMDAVMKIADKYRLKVIEDCAESHFAEISGRRVGSYSDIACFSTYVAHTITTGVGGISCCKEPEYAEIMRSLIAHGRACTCERCVAADGRQVCPKRMDTEIDRRFMFVRTGYSYRVGEIEGALGLAQLERKDEIMEKRRKNAEYLIRGLKRYESLIWLPRHEENIVHTYMMFPILIRENSDICRKSIVEYLEKHNIETRPMLPLLNQPVYKTLFGEQEQYYPNAGYINNNGFYIGVHHGLAKEQLDGVINVLREYLEPYI